MSDQSSSSISFLLPAGSHHRGAGYETAGHSLPTVLGGNARSGELTQNAFINERVVHVESVFDLSGVARGSGEGQQQLIEGTRLLTLEATDGTTLVIRADKLAEDLARLYPDTAPQQAQGQVQFDLSVLSDQEAAARGIGSWIWSTLSVLNIEPDSLVELAKDKALELIKEQLGEAYEDLIYAGASWAGAKGLMWAIESKLEGQPGLYRWGGASKQLQETDWVGLEDPELVQAAQDQQPILVFIHAAASSTVGSFGGLREGADEGCWDNLTHGFEGRVYGFEHRTFSESPIENALLLARSLPKNTTLSLITHSRGGLIGDLLCIDEFTDDMISRYQRKPIHLKEGESESDANKKLREAVAMQERNQLRMLRDILQEKNFKIQRYMRVACPASGTTLLADNLDLFLSTTLSLFNTAVGLIPAVGSVGGAVLSAFRRMVLEIAEKRIDPRLIPGIEAMLPDSPMAVLLAQAKRRDGIDMAVIAGDADGDSGGFLKRIAIMLTDWIMFDHFDNDFVVDTQSMRAGLARRNPTREFYTHGHQVSHIHYFERLDTRRALCQWLTDDSPQDLPSFNPIPTDFELKLDEGSTDTQRSARDVVSDQPIVFYLPGVMGSHLEIAKPTQGKGEGDRVWFDPFDLAAGGIGQIVIDKDHVRPEGLFRRYYSDLESYLGTDNEVISVAYDWRLSINQTADELAALVEQTLQRIEGQARRPISFLAHSMGGLLVRTLIARHPKLWKTIASEHDGHFVMLGTPNHGSHLAVENLMGKGESVRKLARLDFHHDLQEIIDIMGDFEGMLQLLPPSTFNDTGVMHLPEGHRSLGNYHGASAWRTIRKRNHDRWFEYDAEAGLGAKPTEARLAGAEAFWKQLKHQDKPGGLPYADRIAYVYGLDGHTPCGVSYNDQQLYMHGTVRGDGAVSWDSGQLQSLASDRYWYMPVSHCELTCTATYFPAIADLLRRGKTTQLSDKPPRTRSSAAVSYHYGAGPVLQPGAEDLALSFFGGRPRRNLEPDTTQILKVSVKAMDLRFVQQPLMCGHYVADSIAGAERQIDQHLVNGALSQRERLGVYASEVGSSTIVLNSRSAEEYRRGSGRGAIIVGLGEWSSITSESLSNTVRDGVLQYLLQANECQPLPQNASDNAKAPHNALSICSLLIGYNSTTHITVSASIEAIVQGVCEANQQYRYKRSKQQPERAITSLEFVEFYRDTAITAAYAVKELPQRLDKALKRMNARLIPESELLFSEGMRERLSDRSKGSGYWSRLMVTDADQDNAQCPTECYQSKWVSPIPQAVRESLQQQMGGEVTTTSEAPTAFAERIKYVYLSERARAEATIQQRQPGLIEALIKDAITDTRYKPEISHTLFQLMVPLELKATARQTERLLLVLDGYTANLPWEMLQADEEPLANKISIVRQLVSTRFRRHVMASTEQSACVIGNPSTQGFQQQFDVPINPNNTREDGSLASLVGAASEAHKVAKTLSDNGYQVERVYPTEAKAAPQHRALDVFNALFKQPYRILMIAAHGEVNVRSRSDGKLRTGVVLSDGVMLTAAEIGQMEVVPDLVFLNCCHLAKTDPSSTVGYNRLAYSVARELIEMGVRCVIAAGWAVDDQAACTFSETFFNAFVGEGKTFGDAVFQARRTTYKLHIGLNTWGAYQAYGDPNYVLAVGEQEKSDHDQWTPVAPQELTARLESLTVDLAYNSEQEDTYSFQALTARIDKNLSRVPKAWVSQPGTQYLLARLYGGMLPDGFQLAREACQRAIYEDDKESRVPIEALQYLANLESRQAEALSFSAQKLSPTIQLTSKGAEKERLVEHQSYQFSEARRLSQQAIDRLKGLLDITHDMQVGCVFAESGTVNTERFALLGGAYKRQALIHLREHQDEPWESIQPILKASQAAYDQAKGASFGYDFDPYAMINYLQLSGVLGQQVSNSALLIEKAQEASRRQFAKQHDFFSALMVADAKIAAYLLDADKAGGEADWATTADNLLRFYIEVIGQVPRNSRQFNSGVQQLHYLAELLYKRAAKEEESAVVSRIQAKVIKAVATGLAKL